VDHGRRRRIWDRAFTPAAVKSYRPLLHNRLVQLTEQLDARVGKPLDLAEWMSFLSVDFMGDFAYGGMFNSVTQGVDHAGVHDAGVVLLGASETLGTLPWLRPIVARLIQYRPPAFRDLAIRVVESRQEKGTSFRDLFYYLVSRCCWWFLLSSVNLSVNSQLNEDGEGTHPPLNRPTLAGEAMLALVAGSDTTGTALANAMYYLMTHPDCMSRLRAELDCAAGEGAAYDIDIEEDKLVDLKYLQAVINETLRLQPALPNGAQRMPPHNGGPVVVAGQYVASPINLRYFCTHYFSVWYLWEPPSRSRLGLVSWLLAYLRHAYRRTQYIVTPATSCRTLKPSGQSVGCRRVWQRHTHADKSLSSIKRRICRSATVRRFHIHHHTF
jgi:cytochrome P450